jgi:uncharacterized protein (DUF2267 family)
VRANHQLPEGAAAGAMLAFEDDQPEVQDFSVPLRYLLGSRCDAYMQPVQANKHMQRISTAREAQQPALLALLERLPARERESFASQLLTSGEDIAACTEEYEQLQAWSSEMTSAEKLRQARRDTEARLAQAQSVSARASRV